MGPHQVLAPEPIPHGHLSVLAPSLLPGDMGSVHARQALSLSDTPSPYLPLFLLLSSPSLLSLAHSCLGICYLNFPRSSVGLFLRTASGVLRHLDMLPFLPCCLHERAVDHYGSHGFCKAHSELYSAPSAQDSRPEGMTTRPSPGSRSGPRPLCPQDLSGTQPLMGSHWPFSAHLGGHCEGVLVLVPPKQHPL